jgi:hypothetical protein
MEPPTSLVTTGGALLATLGEAAAGDPPSAQPATINTTKSRPQTRTKAR